MNKFNKFLLAAFMSGMCITSFTARAFSMFPSFYSEQLSQLSAKVSPSLFNFQHAVTQAGSQYVSTLSQDPGLAALGIVSAHYLYNGLRGSQRPKKFYRSAAAYTTCVAAGAYCGVRLFPYVLGSTKNYIVPAAFLGMYLSQTTSKDSKNPTTSTLLVGALSDLFRYGLRSIRTSCAQSYNAPQRQKSVPIVFQQPSVILDEQAPVMHPGLTVVIGKPDTADVACQPEESLSEEVGTQTDDEGHKNYIRLLHSVVTHGLEPLLQEKHQRFVVTVSSRGHSENTDELRTQEYRVYPNGSMWSQLFKIQESSHLNKGPVTVSIQHEKDGDDLSESVAFEQDPVQIEAFRGSMGFVAVGYSRAEFDLRQKGLEPFPGNYVPCTPLNPQYHSQFEDDRQGTSFMDALTSGATYVGQWGTSALEKIAPHVAAAVDSFNKNQNDNDSKKSNEF